MRYSQCRFNPVEESVFALFRVSKEAAADTAKVDRQPEKARGNKEGAPPKVPAEGFPAAGAHKLGYGETVGFGQREDGLLMEVQDARSPI